MYICEIRPVVNSKDQVKNTGGREFNCNVILTLRCSVENVRLASECYTVDQVFFVVFFFNVSSRSRPSSFVL